MTDQLEKTLQGLRAEYLSEAPERIAELRRDLGALRAGEPDAAGSLKSRFHRLAGSGGSYGFPEISTISRGMEQFLAAHPTPAEDQLEKIAASVNQLAAEFDRAAGTLEAPAAPPSAQPVQFRARALVVAASGPLLESVTTHLRAAGFDIMPEEESYETGNALGAPKHPDLVVIVAQGRDAEPYSTAAAWSGRRGTKPRAIVLVEDGAVVDPLRAVAAGIDGVIPAARMADELPRYAKTLAIIGTPPAKVLVVEDDPAQSAALSAILETANVRITVAADGESAREALLRELPDLCILDVHLPGIDGFSLARLIRQDQRLNLMPIVFLTVPSGPGDQIEAIRAGGDDFLSKPVDPALLLQIVVSRVERGRRIREMAHRDGLTGLLNHSTLMAELEHAVEYARRHQTTLAFLMIDLDRFKHVNDQYGHLVGDEVLVHVAHVFQSKARASDLIGRYGGEEFGMILLSNSREGAMILASKLQETLRAMPAPTSAGQEVPITMSIGVSAYPDDGRTASALVLAADKALYRAKSRGRGRVESAETAQESPE